VGTTSPDSKLDVNGSTRSGYDTNTTSYFGRSAIGYVGHSDWAGFAHIDRNNLDDYSLLQNSSGRTILNCKSTEKISFSSGDSAQMTMLGTGNFGIGTTTPRTNLHIGQQLNSQGDKDTIPSAGLGISADFPSSTHAWFANRVNATGDEYWGLAIGTIYDGSSYLQNLNKNSATYYNLLLQPNGGNVGIGTTSPTAKLHIKSSSGGDGIAIVNPAGGTGGLLNSSAGVRGGILISNAGGGSDAADNWSSQPIILNGGGTGATNGNLRGGSIWSMWGGSQYGLAFKGASDGDSVPEGGTTPNVFISSDKVGIGTTSPSGKLEVYDTTNTKSLLNVRAGSGTGARTEINSGIRFDYNSIESYAAGGSSSANREYHIRFNTGRKMALFYNNDDLQFWWGGGGNYTNRASVGQSAEFGFTFTGQHRNFIKDVPYRDVIDRQLSGLIVSANNNKYIKITGGIEKGSNAITQNESLPLLSLSSKALDKSCFGVISESEDPNTDRSGSLGMFRSFYDTEDGDKRVIINSVGEGAIWVTNINGNLESGDYITTSNVAGYGQKQDSDSLKNYTVAKITMDCDFDPVTQPIQNIKKGETGENILDEHGQIQWEDHPKETEKAYKIRYLDADGNITNEANHVHIAAFVGCTYHCG